jgi:hypothetical protein
VEALAALDQLGDRVAGALGARVIDTLVAGLLEPGGPRWARPALNLVVVYAERLAECRAFYTALGLPLRREQHGDGPVHYAVVLAGGSVLELYPATSSRSGSGLRLGLSLPRGGRLEPGEHVLRDPDGRTVVVTVH